MSKIVEANEKIAEKVVEGYKKIENGVVEGFGSGPIAIVAGVLLSIGGGAAMLVGIPVGILGMVPVCLAYPLYNRIVHKERQKIAPEIIRLTDELMK